MKNLLAKQLLFIQYTGTGAATVAFDADGGTNSEGLITLTDAGVSTTFAMDDYASLYALVTAISALTNWEARPYYGLPRTTPAKASELTGRPMDDLAETAVARKQWQGVGEFTNDYETVATGTNALLTAVAVATEYNGSRSITMEVTAGSGETSDVTFLFFNNRRGHAANEATGWTDADFDGAWDTDALDDEIVITAAGTTTQRATVQVDCSGLPQIRLGQITNDNAGSVQVSGSFNN